MLPNRGRLTRVTSVITTASPIIDRDRLSLSGRGPSLAAVWCRWLGSLARQSLAGREPLNST